MKTISGWFVLKEGQTLFKEQVRGGRYDDPTGEFEYYEVDEMLLESRQINYEDFFFVIVNDYQTVVSIKSRRD